MSAFHITKSGDPALCKAERRACPLGVEARFATAEEAADYAMKKAMDEDMATFEQSYLTDEAMDEMAEEPERLRYFDQDWYRNNGAYGTGNDLTHSLHEWMGNEVENSDLTEQGESDLARRLAEAGGEADWDEMTAPYLTDTRKQDAWVLPSDDDLGLSGFDDEFSDEAYFAQWDEDEGQATLRDMFADDMPEADHDEVERYYTAEEWSAGMLAKAQTVADGLRITAPPTLFNEQRSQEASVELENFRGRKALRLLAEDLEKQAAADLKAGKLTQAEYEDELDTVRGLQYLLNPAEGLRTNGPKEPKPLDPELIQALRCLYMKKFHVDPFEQGVSVPELLQMRQRREI